MKYIPLLTLLFLLTQASCLVIDEELPNNPIAEGVEFITVTKLEYLPELYKARATFEVNQEGLNPEQLERIKELYIRIDGGEYRTFDLDRTTFAYPVTRYETTCVEVGFAITGAFGEPSQGVCQVME